VVAYGQPAPSPVVVVIKRSPPPEVEPRVHYGPPRQITYFIAFKTSHISLADQYWVNGATLYYVTSDHLQKTAPLDSVDRALSERLNSEQGVAFQLPAEKPKPEVKSRPVHHTSAAAGPHPCAPAGRTPASH
jgi:hypothetical protein